MEDMPTSPRLVTVSSPPDPSGVVLVLHGGASRGERVAVSPTQLSVLRMVPTARAIARAGRRRVAVLRLLNSYRGWDAGHTPLDDVAWALGQVRERYGAAPVGLVGHSLGGRAALLAGGSEPVVSVVALNPWVYPTDTADLSGRQVLVVHGGQDRIAKPERAAAVASRISRSTEVEFVRIPGAKHAMLRHGKEFDRRAAEFTTKVLLSRV